MILQVPSRSLRLSPLKKWPKPNFSEAGESLPSHPFFRGKKTRCWTSGVEKICGKMGVKGIKFHKNWNIHFRCFLFIVFISVLLLLISFNSGLVCYVFILHFCCKRTNAPHNPQCKRFFFPAWFQLLELFAQSWSSVSACLPRNHLNAVFLDCLGREDWIHHSIFS